MLGSELVASAYTHPFKSNSAPSRAGSWRPAAEVWLRFVLALVGLALAFGAALFSTASREAGDLLSSVILASLALLVAAWVGLVTVPYLARRVAVERFRESFDYEVTKVGVMYVLVTLVIGIAALNTGNNLLYIVVAAMLAAMLVSGVVSALGLRGLELDVRLPEHVFAGRAVAGRILLRNPRRFLPSFSIRVVPARSGKKTSRKRWRWQPTTFAFPSNRAPKDQWFRVRDWKVMRVSVIAPPAGIFEGMVHFPYLPPRAILTADLDLRFERRGRYCESSFGVATGFPFAFLTKRRNVALQREILVYPPVDAPDELLQILPVVRGEWESFARGRGSDLYRIREYMPEDSARHVDWKATAKSGSLKVREFSREDERKLRIVFDNPCADAISGEAYERAVNLAASLAWHYSSQQAEVSFLVSDGGRDGGRRGCRSEDIHEFLACLAVIAPQPPLRRERQDALERDVLEEIDLGNHGAYSIVLTARAQASLPAAWRDSAYFIFLR
jgi:uncharacterized protein (DUF58 family)